jgi:hypothetical protein
MVLAGSVACTGKVANSENILIDKPGDLMGYHGLSGRITLKVIVNQWELRLWSKFVRLIVSASVKLFI